MDLLTGNCEAAERICEALGLNPREVVRLRFTLEPGRAAVVEVERLVPTSQGDGIAERLTRYNLVPADQRGESDGTEPG